MDYINVHKSADGPKLRALYKRLQCSKFEALGILISLWFWGSGNADERGCVMHADEEDVRAHISGECVGCALDPPDIVEALIETGWLDKRDNGQLWIHDWEDWQGEYYSREAKRRYDREYQRMRRAAMARKENEGPPPESPAPPESPVLSIREPERHPKRRQSEYPVSFRELWEVYPRKDDKKRAHVMYQARLKEGYSEEELMEAAKRYASDMKKKGTQKEYILMAKTFFGIDGRFTQYLPENPPQPAAKDTRDNPFWKYGGG